MKNCLTLSKGRVVLDVRTSDRCGPTESDFRPPHHPSSSAQLVHNFAALRSASDSTAQDDCVRASVRNGLVQGLQKCAATRAEAVIVFNIDGIRW